MHDPLELLAMLTARVQRFHMAPGGIPAITSDDIAHALGMIHNDEARLYARLKYCHQHTYAEGLALFIRRFILMKKLSDRWRIPRPGFVFDLSCLMLAEAIDPHVCSWCRGRGERPEIDEENKPTGKLKPCDQCHETGRRSLALREADRARLMDMSRSAWHNTWDDRYQDAQRDTISKWESIIQGALRKRMRA